MASIRNIAVVELRSAFGVGETRPQVLTELVKGDAFEAMSALYSTAVDVINCMRGRGAMRELTVEYAYNAIQNKDVILHNIDNWVELFARTLNRSPVLIVDWTLDTKHIGIWHPADWHTNANLPEDFKATDALRSQSISVSAYWLYQVLKYRERANTDNTYQDDFLVAVFRVVVMFVHEIGYLMIAWVAKMSAVARPENIVHDRHIAYLPWKYAGARLEWLLFGGQIEFRSTRIGKFRIISPWLFSEKAYRVDFLDIKVFFDRNEETESIANFIRSRGIGYDLEHPTERSQSSVAGIGKNEGCIVNFHKRLGQCSGSPLRSLAFWLEGKDWNCIYLNHWLELNQSLWT